MRLPNVDPHDRAFSKLGIHALKSIVIHIDHIAERLEALSYKTPKGLEILG